ncbi:MULTISPECIES: aminotransferase-like domain-containing protein [unclassified Cupriavidus]|uniref:aminotransferase-like domain-containing protein n=1 Tax=unclassified Cupriavidus TaxID=2640874 RepID=UPI00313B2C20
MTAPLYQQLATRYRQAIHAGTLAPGDRMPSVRTLMGLHDVSLSTALQACRELEAAGLLEARPRSGYFVCAPMRPALRPLAEPDLSLPDADQLAGQFAGIHARISSIMASWQRHEIRVDFGGAFCAPALYPNDALRTAATRALRRHPDLYGHVVQADGHAPFRVAVARHAMRARIRVAPEDIAITYGCTEALHLALRAVTSPGDAVAVESPTYYGLLQTLESLGLRAVEVPCSPQTGISLEALELAAQTHADIKAVVVVPNLQNPLGCIMPDANKARLVAWCEGRGLALIEDDCFSGTVDDDVPLAAAKAWDTTGNVIYCASLNKVLAPGLRLGWMAAGKWQARVEMLKIGITRPNAALPQIIAADFMHDGGLERHLRRLRVQLRAQREWVAGRIARTFPEGTRLTLPRGGMHLWIALPEDLSGSRIADRALQQGIRVLPGAMFSNSTRYDRYLRVNCGAPRSDEIERALDTLATIVLQGAR